MGLGKCGEGLMITHIGNTSGYAIDGGSVGLTLATLEILPNDVVIVCGGHPYRAGVTNIGPLPEFGYTEVVKRLSVSPEFGVWWKVMGATPDPIISCYGTGNAQDGAAYVAFILRGVDINHVVDGYTTALGASGAPNNPAITTASDYSWILALAGSSYNDSTPGTITGYSNTKSVAANDTYDISVAGATKEIPNPLSANDPAVWSSWSSGVWYAVTLNIKPTFVGGLSCQGYAEVKPFWEEMQGGIKTGGYCYTNKGVPTIETIGATGCDYTTPQSWYDAHKGNIVTDSNAPYIGEMKAGTYQVACDFKDSTCDIDHYFHLRAYAGDEFRGKFDGSYPVFDAVATSSNALENTDDYFKLTHIVFKGLVGNTENDNMCFATAGDNVVVDSCGFKDIGENGDQYGISLAGDNVKTTITNCVFADIRCENYDGTKANPRAISALTGENYIYHNTFLRCYDYDGTTYAGRAIRLYGDPVSTANIINNVFIDCGDDGGAVYISDYTATVDYNAFNSAANSDGTHDVVLTYNPYDGTDFHISSTCNPELIGVGHSGSGLTDFPTVDIDEDTRRADMGIDSPQSHGCQLNGTSDYGITSSLAMSAGIKLNGVAAYNVITAVAVAGGCQLNGTATPTVIYNVDIAGGCQLNGTDAHNWIYVHPPDGPLIQSWHDWDHTWETLADAGNSAYMTYTLVDNMAHFATTNKSSNQIERANGTTAYTWQEMFGMADGYRVKKMIPNIRRKCSSFTNCTACSFQVHFFYNLTTTGIVYNTLSPNITGVDADWVPMLGATGVANGIPYSNRTAYTFWNTPIRLSIQVWLTTKATDPTSFAVDFDDLDVTILTQSPLSGVKLDGSAARQHIYNPQIKGGCKCSGSADVTTTTTQSIGDGGVQLAGDNFATIIGDKITRGGISNNGVVTPTTYYCPTILGGVKLYGAAFEFAIGALVLRADIETEPRYTSAIASEPRYTADIESEPRWSSDLESEPRWSGDVESESRFTGQVSLQ